MGFIKNLTGNASEVSAEKLREKYGRLLTENEQIEIGFKLFKDTFIFTEKRLILIDLQSLSGDKVEFKSLPYKNVSHFSLETNGALDSDAELKVWISGENRPSLSKQFDKNIDVYEVQRYLAEKVL